jgi:hypothetical protein
MQPWCSSSDVAARVAGNPSDELCQEFAEQATSILYELSGRKFTGPATLAVAIQVNRRGYLKLTDFAPVSSVTDVSIDGAPVAFALSPGGTYLSVDLALRGKIAEVTLVAGQNVPVSGQRAAASLAADLLRGDPRYAALPGVTDVRQQSRVLSVSRQGVTYTYIDPVTLQQKDMTGIVDVDLFLRAVNPNGMRYQPKVVSTI